MQTKRYNSFNVKWKQTCSVSSRIFSAWASISMCSASINLSFLKSQTNKQTEISDDDRHCNWTDCLSSNTMLASHPPVRTVQCWPVTALNKFRSCYKMYK